MSLFFAGLFVGSIAGMVVAALCASAGRGQDELDEHHDDLMVDAISRRREDS